MAKKVFTDESLETFINEIKSYTDDAVSAKANSSHNHSASNITSGTLSSDRLPTIPISKGGTGATTAAAALTNLGITATAAELNKLDGVTATTAELNCVDGVTSSIQTQLDGKAASGHTHKYAGSSSAGGAATSANKLNTNAGSATQPVYFANGIPVATTYTLGKSVPSDAKFTDTNTHYSSKNVVGATNATSNTATALTNGNVYLNSVENGAVTSSHKISGSGATTVTTDANGNIVISSTDNNTTYSAAGSSLGLVKSGGDVTISSGVITVNDDSHNHTIANIDNLQTTLDGKASSSHSHTITASASDDDVVVLTGTNGSNKVTYSASHANSGVTAGTYKSVTVNAKGHITAGSNPTTLSGYGITNAYTKTEVDTIASGKADTHTHPYLSTGTKYASSSSVGGSATSAVKLDTSTAGDANTPVYFSGGKPVACTSLDLNTSGSSASCTGNSATATKLQTARTIALGTGAIGTATSFNGSANITIPVTDVKEAYLSWGGKNISGGVSPIDAACSNIHSANRFAFSKPNGITIEYSTNGSTYSTYSTTDSAKVNLVSGIGSTYYIGARSSATTVNDKLRITLNATNMGLYTRLQKLLINITTSYATGSNVIIEKSMKGSESTYTTVGTYQISGWSGWNSIPISAAFGGGDNQTGNIANLRLTFGITGVNSAQTSNALTILDIIGIGDTYWSHPSAMAKTGHLYSYDSAQNATFPANVTATTFVGALSGNATTASTATNVAWSGVTSKPSYYDAKAIKSITRSGTTFTYTCMDGTTGTFTQQDNNTTYGVATTSANGLMSSADKSKLDGMVLATVSEVETYLGI